MRLLIGGLLVCVLAGTSAADDPGPTVTSVTGKLVGSEAVFTVQVVVPSTGFDHFRVDLPAHGSVTGATVAGRRLEHVTAAQSQRAMAALTSRAPGNHRRSAIFIDHVQLGTIDVQLMVPATATITVELAIAAPTCFLHDMRYVAVPRSWRPGSAAIRAGKTDVVARSCHVPDHLHGHDWVGFASPQLARRPSGVDRIAGTASRLAIGTTHLAKVELAVAGHLTDVAADLATVILVDGSRSMSSRLAESQRAVVASYLRAAPRSQVQVIVYARTARTVLPAWTPAVQAVARVDRELHANAPRNGSSVDSALQLAATWLGRVKGTKRIIIITDELLPSRIVPGDLRGLIPAGTLVHVVTVRDNLDEIIRVDDGVLGVLARSTRGISVIAGGTQLDATMLARPISYDRVALKTPGWTQILTDPFCTGTRESPTTILEGTTCTWFGIGGAIAGPIVFEGQLWGEPVVRILQPSLGRARELARELSMRQVSFLPNAEHQQALDAGIDREARAVNSAWSLYLEWGTGRDGYSDLGVGGFGLSGTGRTCCSVHHQPRVTIGSPMIDTTPLQRQLRGAIARCTPDPSLYARVEVTLEEIVDVAVKADSIAMRACVEEAIWEAWLVIPAPTRHRTTVHLLGSES